jgi:sensor histidine kinase regulating citrate/malate metabolism
VDELPEVTQERVLLGWTVSQWADRLLEQVGMGVTILDREGRLMFYNQWAANKLDRKPEYIGKNVRGHHRRKITNPRFNAMLKLFEEGRTDPVYYVARPYGGITILVMVSPIRVDGELVGYSQVILLKEEIQELFRRFDESGRESFEKEMLPSCPFSGND